MLSPRKEMTKMAAMSPARCPGGASGIRLRLTPSSASPTPTPATAVPVRKAAAAVAAIAAKVTARPASRTRQPASIAARGEALRNATVAAAATPVSKKISRPPHSRSREPVTCSVSDGPSDWYRPPYRGRHAHPGPERGQDAGARGAGLGHSQYPGGGGHGSAEHQPPH